MTSSQTPTTHRLPGGFRIVTPAPQPLDAAALAGLPAPSASSCAVVTGASQGIGATMARDLAELGYNVVLVARRAADLTDLAQILRDTYGVQAVPFACDLADSKDRARLVRAIETGTFPAESQDENILDAQALEVSILINSAGIASFGPFLPANWDYESTQFELNARALFELTRAAVVAMTARGRGAICNVGSVAGNVPIPNNATYVFTKAGVNAFTEALHYELRGSGVTCTLLSPGPVREAHLEGPRSMVDRVVPAWTWTTYDSCSVETLHAMARGRRRIVPGPLGKFGDALTRLLPTPLIAPLLGKVYAKMGS